MSGIAIAVDAGRVIITNANGMALIGLSPDAAEYLAKELVNAVYEIRTGKRPIADGPPIVVEISNE